MKFNITKNYLATILISTFFVGCSTVNLSAVPEDLTEEAHLISWNDVRFFGDGLHKDSIIFARKKVDQSIASRPEKWNENGVIDVNYLVVTGNGPDNAYGAGLLNGMTDEGNPIEFEVITGVNTGALVASFAFLNEDSDALLKDIYTTPYEELITRHVTLEFLEKIKAEHEKGRRLFVGTTNLDAQRAVIWDLGEISRFVTVDSLDLFHRVLLASASTSATTKIRVEAGGTIYEELHVGAGITNNAYFLPLNSVIGDYLKELGLTINTNMYVIRNSSSNPSWGPVENDKASVAARSIETLVKSLTTGDLHRLYSFTEVNGIGFQVITVPDVFNEKTDQQFDPTYMRKLYDLGYNNGLIGVAWKNNPF